MVFLASDTLWPRHAGKKSLLRPLQGRKYLLRRGADPATRRRIACPITWGGKACYAGGLALREALKTFRDRKLIGYEKSFSDFSSGI